MTRTRATLTGFGAVLLWALLALFTTASGAMPPLQLAAMTFAIGAGAGALVMCGTGRSFRALRQPPRVWAIGVGGLFGYHFVYFSALRAAPAAEASLIAYLWPLLIVLLSALAPGERLLPRHVIGATLGFLGAALLVTKGQSLAFDPAHARGYGLALLAAFIWSGYSVLSRALAHVPTEAVTGFCAVTALLATCAHLALEPTVWPAQTTEWLAILGLGLGPVGLAFFLWDVGVKRGDIQVLGAASYAAPLLSTLVLVAADLAAPTWSLAVACALITLGAGIAAGIARKRT
jgi:drug/metabolite transporter (DMT)-like permease